jgi:NADPH2:quinone reductase
VKAAYIEAPGPPEAIRYGDLPRPAPKGRELLVRVAAVAVNPIDTYIRAGIVKMALPSPFIVGCDLAGTVEAAGPEARRFRPGDRVWGSNQGLLGRQGTFAEYACCDEEYLYGLPAGVKETDAAAAALVGITAHLGLFRCARLRAGETVFVNGGTGGVGSMVVQMARAAGARAVATVGSAEKAAACRALGAERAVNYKTEDVAAALREATGGAGVDVWFETQREQDFLKAVELIRPRGRMIVMAGRDARPIFPTGPFYVKDLSLHGFAMFNATPDEQRACADDINRWLAEGRLKAAVGRTFRLAETAAAHKLQEENTLGKAGTLSGKIVLVP